MKKNEKTSDTVSDTAEDKQNPLHHRDYVLTDDEAVAGSPDDTSLVGEEDPGSGLEFLVEREQHRSSD